jgi:hypothetical protein
LFQGRRFFRCRLDTVPSWGSRLLLALVTIGSCSVTAFFREEYPYAWFALASIAFAFMFIAVQERVHAREVAALLATVAKRIGLYVWTGSFPDEPSTTGKPGDAGASLGAEEHVLAVR